MNFEEKNLEHLETSYKFSSFEREKMITKNKFYEFIPEEKLFGES